MSDPSKTYFDVTPELVVQLMTTKTELHARVVEGLPIGTKIVAVTWVPERQGDPEVEGCRWVRFWVVNDREALKEGAMHISVETLPCRPSTT